MTSLARLPLVIAHRGASAAHPPGNTLAAFGAAVALGADGVELDVRRGADGALVVHHDPDLADGRSIHRLSADELPGWVPLLDGALAVCAEARLTVNVEIKNSPLEADFDARRGLVDDVLDSLAGWDPADVLISSFDPDAVAKVRRLDSPFPTALLLWDPASMVEDLRGAARAGHVAVNPWSPCVDADLVGQANRLGLDVNVWTVDDPDEMRSLIALGVGSIITDVPDVARAVLDEG